jgi:maltose O-acetyltransferase
MKYKKIEFSFGNLIALFIYKVFLVWLPASTTPIVGKLIRKLRYMCCKHIFLYCGENVNIERGAFFGSGFRLKIGNNSGIGINCHVPGNIEIGENVMMGPECHILSINHRFDRIDIPMIKQGSSEEKKTIIEDDVWIGRQVIFTPGRIVKKGSIIATGTVLCKNFEEYSIIGGNPSQLIRMRNNNNNNFRI